MKKEHYEHVSEHFNLRPFHYGNRPEAWTQSREGSVVLSSAYVDYEDNTYSIRGLDVDGCVIGIFVNLPNKKLAKEVLRYITATEILFL